MSSLESRAGGARGEAARRVGRALDGERMRDAPSIRVLKRVILVTTVVHVALAGFSGYRAVVQTWSVSVRTPDRVLGAGSVVHASMVSSGRAPGALLLELVQGTRAETLAVHRVPANRSAALDPRPRRAAIATTLTPEVLARFAPGPARLRVTGTGSSQWLRVPPPKVREVAVEVGGGGGSR